MSFHLFAINIDASDETGLGKDLTMTIPSGHTLVMKVVYLKWDVANSPIACPSLDNCFIVLTMVRRVWAL